MSLADFDPETWQPVRLPTQQPAIAGDLPKQDAFVSRELDDMLAWSKKHCRGAWFHVNEPRTPVVFWFEQPGDAQQFALTWFPYRCL